MVGHEGEPPADQGKQTPPIILEYQKVPFVAEVPGILIYTGDTNRLQLDPTIFENTGVEK